MNGPVHAEVDLEERFRFDGFRDETTHSLNLFNCRIGVLRGDALAL